MIRSINFDLCDTLVQTAGDASPAATAGPCEAFLKLEIIVKDAYLVMQKGSKLKGATVWMPLKCRQ